MTVLVVRVRSLEPWLRWAESAPFREELVSECPAGGGFALERWPEFRMRMFREASYGMARRVVRCAF